MSEIDITVPADTARMPITSIKIGVRHRKDMGDIDGMARSIAEIGLLHPIVVKSDGELIAGERRLRAFQALGRTEVPVRIVDMAEIVRGELAENAERKDFTPSEIDAIRRALEPIEKADAEQRMKAGTPAKVSQGSGRVTDKIGSFAGVSGRTVEKIADVVAAAEREPERYSHLVEEMDKTGKVDRARKQLRIERERQAYVERTEVGGKVAHLHELVAAGRKFPVILIDPPWEFLTHSDKGKDRSAETHYDVMTLDQIKALPVKTLAADDAVLFLWIVDWFPPELILQLIKAWDFEHKTTAFTWAKTNPNGEGWHLGQGYWTRANPETCWLCTRGHPQRLNADVRQLIVSPVREHSQKPDETHERIERLVVGPYLELFARAERPNWITWGNEVPVIAAAEWMRIPTSP
jgi:N6-adenosine-specific RNA methylase IME4